MSSVLVATALVSITLGAVSGFALLIAVDRPGLLRRLGIVDPVRVRQVHLDWIMMGTMLAVVGLAVPALPVWIGVLVWIGAVVNPLTFIPMAYSKSVATTKWFQIASFISFTALCAGLLLATMQYIVQLR